MQNGQLQAWHQSRHADVTAAQGDLSLIAMYDLASAIALKEIAGHWQPTTLDKPGLTLTATANDRLFLDGQLIEGTVELIADETIIHSEAGMTAMATSQPGSLHLLAIWDAHCGALTSFSHIDAYAYNEQAIYIGKLATENAMYQFSHTGDANETAREHESIGIIHVEIAGQSYQLRPFQSGTYSIIVFRDATSGNETYGMGRMLVIQPHDDGTVLLDFNKAFLPPCAFSPYFNCPMPPMSNRIQVKMEAGEKQIITR